jgi:hypothetical protein
MRIVHHTGQAIRTGIVGLNGRGTFVEPAGSWRSICNSRVHELSAAASPLSMRTR